MRKYFDEAEARRYIKKYDLTAIIPEIESYGADRLTLIAAEKGDMLHLEFRENETEKLIFLVEGIMKNYAVTENGRKTLLHFSENFEMLRDLEFLNISGMSVRLEAVGKVKFLEVDLRGKREQMMNNPAFLQAMLQQIGRKLAKTTIAQTMTAVYPLGSRLSSYLLYMTAEQKGENKVFSENLIETAELLGTSYRHLLRMLKEFCEAGALVHLKKGYRVADEDWLADKASDSPIYGKHKR